MDGIITKINDISEVHSGVTFRKGAKDKSEVAFNIIQLSDIDDYQRILPENLSQSDKINPKSRHLLEPGDVIFSSKGEYNFATVIPDSLGETVAVSTFLVLKQIRKNVLPGYLAWFINSKMGQNYLDGIRKRTSIPYVSKTNFVEMPVVIPSLKIQELIVKIERLKVRELELRTALKTQRQKLIDATLLGHINKTSTR